MLSRKKERYTRSWVVTIYDRGGGFITEINCDVCEVDYNNHHIFCYNKIATYWDSLELISILGYNDGHYTCVKVSA